MSWFSSDGSCKDDKGTSYKPAFGTGAATHGQSVLVNDGYGNYTAGVMNFGHAVPTKND